MASSYIYGNMPLKAFNKEIDLDTDTVKVMLMTDSYTPNIDTDIYLDDVSANETSGTGYSAGGATAANKAVTYDSGTNTMKFDFDDTVWTTSTITARYAVIYVATGVESTSSLLCYVDFGSNQASVIGTFTLTYDAAGVFTATV